jgi:hypothetical protein
MVLRVNLVMELDCPDRKVKLDHLEAMERKVKKENLRKVAMAQKVKKEIQAEMAPLVPQELQGKMVFLEKQGMPVWQVYMDYLVLKEIQALKETWVWVFKDLRGSLECLVPLGLLVLRAQVRLFLEKARQLLAIEEELAQRVIRVNLE